MTAGAQLVKDPGDMILALEDSYTGATRVFLRFLENTVHGLDAEGIKAFSDYLCQEHDGKRRATTCTDAPQGIPVRVAGCRDPR
jgi:hypothetical protein